MSKPTFHPLLTLTVIAAAAIAKERRFIGFDGNVAAAGAKALGSNPVTAAAGEAMPVDSHGVILVEAGAAVARGAQVQGDADGRAITLAGGVSNGYALAAATAAGELIPIARGI